MACKSNYHSILLKEVAEIIMGQSPPGNTYNEIGKGLPFYQGVTDFGFRHPTHRVFCTTPKRIAEKGDILLSVRAPIGRVNRALEKCAIGRGLAIVRGENDVDTTFIELFLRSSSYIWDTFESQGSVFGNAKREDLESIKIIWPEQPMRRAIAHILGTLDDKIELNRRMNETLEAMARAIFKSWFVDFDPVRAKMEGRWRRGQSLPGLPAHFYDLFPARLVDSELGQIPEGWKVGRLSDMADILRDQVNPLDSPDEIFAHFSIPAYDNGQRPKTEKGKFIKSLKFLMPPNVVLLSKLNPEIERVWFIDVTPDKRSVCSMEFLVFCAKEPFERGYIYCLLRSAAFRQGLQALVTGTSKSHQRAQASAVMNLLTILPAQSILRAFKNIAEKLLARVLVSRRESRTLVDLRDTLLPKLVSGELRIKDVERIIGRRV